jgi:hypothetical protein
MVDIWTSEKARQSFEDRNWDGVAAFCRRRSPLCSPTLEEITIEGFVHVFPTSVATNCFEVIFEMIEDEVLTGQFVLFYDESKAWIGFNDEMSAINFRLRA